MKYNLLILALVASSFLSSQSLHHQMIGCQGGSFSNSSYKNLLFTVGQQSVIGTFVDNFSVQQGFQQSNWNKLIEQNSKSINTVVYPNPFTDVVNFSFSKSPGVDISICVFDLSGRLVHSEVVKNNNNLISIVLNDLSSSEYFVKLRSNSEILSTKILKQ